ncbi:MAG TPA: hypothetical protein VJN02_00540 [Gammaproteobacteria bacterium]|nr:hypothetical protein [Gammaproteobacteria bacterium]
MTTIARSNIHIIAFTFAAAIAMYFIFLPVINIFFYAGDDFRYAFGNLHQACKADDGFEFMLTLGRPIQAYVDCMVFKYAHTVERMSMVRLFSIVLMAGVIGLLTDYLLGWLSILSAFFMAGSLMLIQHFYVDTILTGSISLPIALIFALLSYRSIERMHFYLDHATTIWRMWMKWGILSAIFLMCSLLTYPAITFFFSVLTLMKLLFSDLKEWIKTRKQLIREVIFFCAICLIYYIWADYNIHYHALAPVTQDQYALNHPNFSLSEIIHRLFILENIFSDRWAISPISNTMIQACIMMAFIVGGCFFSLIKFLRSNFFLYERKIALITFVQVIMGVLLLILLCNSFMLIMPSLILSELRILFCIVTSGFILVFWGMRQCSSIFSVELSKSSFIAASGLVFLITVYQANVFMTASAIACKQYILFVQRSISAYLSEEHKLQRIHYIVSVTDYPYNKFFLTNVALTPLLGYGNYQLQWCSLPRGVPGKEENHQAEVIACIDRLPSHGIAVTYSYPEKSFINTSSMVTIDMQQVSVANYTQQNLKHYFS